MENFNKYKHLFYMIILVIGLAFYLMQNRYLYIEQMYRTDKWTGKKYMWDHERGEWEFLKRGEFGYDRDLREKKEKEIQEMRERYARLREREDRWRKFIKQYPDSIPPKGFHYIGTETDDIIYPSQDALAKEEFLRFKKELLDTTEFRFPSSKTKQ